MENLKKLSALLNENKKENQNEIENLKDEIIWVERKKLKDYLLEWKTLYIKANSNSNFETYYVIDDNLERVWWWHFVPYDPENRSIIRKMEKQGFKMPAYSTISMNSKKPYFSFNIPFINMSKPFELYSNVVYALGLDGKLQNQRYNLI